MQFQTCTHGNIAMTCPQCKGRAVRGSAAPAPQRGSGFSEARALLPNEAAPGEETVEDLYNRTADPVDRFNIMMGSKLGEIVDKDVKRVERTVRSQQLYFPPPAQ